MPRPLKIYKNIVEEDTSAIQVKISALLGETIALGEELFRLLASCLNVLIQKDKASTADICIVDLGVRLWNDMRAANILIQRGLYLPAMMIERDGIETVVVAEYLHKKPQNAEDWRKAESLKERRRFGIHELQNEVKDGQEWKHVWDWLSSYIHPNCLASPVYGATKEYYGHNLYLDGFYQPGSAGTFQHMQLSICHHFVQNLWDWYKDELPFPSEMQTILAELEIKYKDQTDKLKGRTRSEQKEMSDRMKETRLTHTEIIQMFKYLDTLE